MDPFDSDALRHLRQFDSLARNYLKANPAVEAMQRMADEQGRILESYTGGGVARALYEQMASTRALYEQAMSPTIRTTIDAVSEQARQRDVILKSLGTALPDTVADFAKQYAEAFERTEFLSAISHVQSLDTLVATHISGFADIERFRRELGAFGIAWPYATDNARLPSSKTAKWRSAKDFLLAKEVLFNIALAIFIALYAESSQRQMEVRVTDDIRASEAKAETRLHGLEELVTRAYAAILRIEAMRVRFEVKEREALIRRAPKDGAAITARLSPGDFVLLIEERGKWIEVEYRDAQTQEPRSGWALKKYFRRVPRDEDKTP